ncbi:Glu/Leu/Phe/Val dehydrogenase dimerization domain-containing protein [Nocardioides sp.]|uniref:Glu/Leu/Phe/Val family dehydrogenase n=1 Tax=Nocardioides sp. TaxID=35761 RepID=UPI0026333615|nr:Glu/Leu/Phe/Val dehydrogenase dimerization domain-containing protein [Nocardioides sp.]MDI6912376.1 Glu/Leu/Phe/Val dehydrogenase dimerization domain-containing protein [Nocardioides sp.]
MTIALHHASGVFDRDDDLAGAGHEQVVFCRDVESGLRAIISIHDTTLGPALGGTRFFPYPNEPAALRDGLRLSQGMTFKSAAAGMPLGGGKAVIIGDPAVDKTPGLLRAYGRFIERLGGTYVTAADVGTTSDDLDTIGEETRHVVGRNVTAGGSGDSGLSTARGVFHAMRAAAGLAWPADGIRGRTVGVEGAGKVGYHLIGLLLAEGASVVFCDPSAAARRRVLDGYGEVAIAESVLEAQVDVYAPCALGATITQASVASLRATIVCGAANNQLATGNEDATLFERGVTWVPDYVANAGGLIQVGGELQNKTPDDVLRDIRRIADTTHEIVSRSVERQVPTGVAAFEIVRARLSGHAASTGAVA